MKNYFKKVKNFVSLRIEDYKQNRKMLCFYKKLIRKGSLCFDVGANIGNRTDIFIKLGAKVVAIEPQKKCFDLLNKKYHNKSSVTIINKALGEKEGKEKIMIGEASTVSSISKEWIESVKESGRFGNLSWDEGYEVPVVTLDSIIELHGLPDFCKIDVEGFEYEVLKGLSKPISVISFEFTPEFMEATVDCINHLSNIGDYRYSYSLGGRYPKHKTLILN